LMAHALPILGERAQHLADCTHVSSYAVQLVMLLLSWLTLWEADANVAALPAAVAGDSLAGTLAALVVAGVLSVADALKTASFLDSEVRLPPEFEVEALHICGLPKDKVDELCNSSLAWWEEDPFCVVYACESPISFWCKGDSASIHELNSAAQREGAVEVEWTGGSLHHKVDELFHTARAQRERQTLQLFLQDMLPRMKTPRITVHMGSIGAFQQGDSTKRIENALAALMTECVHLHNVLSCFVDQQLPLYCVTGTQHVRHLTKHIQRDNTKLVCAFDIVLEMPGLDLRGGQKQQPAHC